MGKVLAAALSAAIALCATPATAQLGAEANGARADGRWGGELGVGYALPILPRLKVVPAVGVLIFAENNDRFRRDPVGNSTRCRDTTNGQFANDELCNNTAVRAYGRVEAIYSIPLLFNLGVGARISNEVVPYGTVAFPIGPRLSLKGNVGDGYYAAGLRLGF